MNDRNLKGLIVVWKSISVIVSVIVELFNFDNNLLVFVFLVFVVERLKGIY